MVRKINILATDPSLYNYLRQVFCCLIKSTFIRKQPHRNGFSALDFIGSKVVGRNGSALAEVPSPMGRGLAADLTGLSKDSARISGVEGMLLKWNTTRG